MNHRVKKVIKLGLCIVAFWGMALSTQAAVKDYKLQGSFKLEDGRTVSYKTTLHNYIGTLKVKLPIIWDGDESFSVSHDEIPVYFAYKDENGPEIEITAACTGKNQSFVAESYPGTYDYDEEQKCFIGNGQCGTGGGNLKNASINVGGGCSRPIMLYWENQQALDAGKDSVFWVGMDHLVAFITPESEKYFLENGHLSEFDTYNWPGLKELLTSGGSNEPTTGAGKKTVIQAKYSAISMNVDGKVKACEAYNIDNSNYFKLRDLAAALNGTDKQFNVIWDNTQKCIGIATNTSYVKQGSELSAGDKKDKIAQVSNAKLLVNEEPVEVTAYMINNNVYYSVRDLANILGVDIKWNQEKQSIDMNTK